MTTTIQVDNDTAEFLKGLREQYGVSSYNAVIRLLFRKAMKPEKSMWGFYGKLSRKEILKDLRDKSDRY
jgi:hypothetical protein